MDNALEGTISDRQPLQLGWFILLFLLLLRIPYTIAIIYFLPIENQMGSGVYEVSTYFLTCFLIWWERKRLFEFHFDSAALFLVLFMRPIQTLILHYWNVDSPLAWPHPFGVALWLISLGSIVALWHSGYKPRHVSFPSMLWILIGLLVGSGISIGENFQTFRSMLQDALTVHSQVAATPLLYSAGLNVLYHLSFAPLNEEPLFRGFLWGYLRQLKWNEVVIWLFQAVLFTSAHVYLVSQFPMIFWVFIPIAGLLLGLLAWRARSIAPGILAHGMVNGSIYLLIAIFFQSLY